jgi:hypothetical protein
VALFRLLDPRESEKGGSTKYCRYSPLYVRDPLLGSDHRHAPQVRPFSGPHRSLQGFPGDPDLLLAPTHKVRTYATAVSRRCCFNNHVTSWSSLSWVLAMPDNDKPGKVSSCQLPRGTRPSRTALRLQHFNLRRPPHFHTGQTRITAAAQDGER